MRPKLRAQLQPADADDEEDMTVSVGVRPILRLVLSEASGPSAGRIERALGLLLEELGMDVAFVGELDDGARVVVTHTANAPRVALVPVGLDHPVKETLCQLFITGNADLIVSDVRAHGELADHPDAALFGVGAYAGVPLLVGGTVIGAVCCAASSPVPVIHERDITTLRTVAEYVSAVLRLASSDTATSLAASPVPAARNELERVAGALAGGASLELLSRPLLEMLQTATGLDSTYLTAVDWAADQQRVLYAVNKAEMQIPEGVAFDWSDTLCRRSLDEGRTCTTDVPSLWGDSDAAAALGITTYVSIPVLDPDSNVIGTLCGASSRAVDVDPRHLATMRMFAVLIGQQIAAQASATTQQQRAADLQSRLSVVDGLALRDPLTGLFNRRGVERWLVTAFSNILPGVEQVAIGFCDLDGFKKVNDTLGHAVGDDALRSFAAAISTIGRDGDLHGRLGGDEFVVAAVLSSSAAALGAWKGRLRRAASITVTAGSRPYDVRASVGVAAFTTSTTPDQALSAADAAMYLDKASRRAAR